MRCASWPGGAISFHLLGTTSPGGGCPAATRRNAAARPGRPGRRHHGQPRRASYLAGSGGISPGQQRFSQRSPRQRTGSARRRRDWLARGSDGGDVMVLAAHRLPEPAADWSMEFPADPQALTGLRAGLRDWLADMGAGRSRPGGRGTGRLGSGRQRGCSMAGWPSRARAGSRSRRAWTAPGTCSSR